MSSFHIDILGKIKRVENFLKRDCQLFCNHCSFEAKGLFEVMFHPKFYHASLIAAVCKSQIWIWSKVELKVAYALCSSDLEK